MAAQTFAIFQLMLTLVS